MGNPTSTTQDAGKPVQAIVSDVLTVFKGYAGQLTAAGQAVGVSALQVAAPVAREMNKVDVGDYNPGSGYLPGALSGFG